MEYIYIYINLTNIQILKCYETLVKYLQYIVIKQLNRL